MKLQCLIVALSLLAACKSPNSKQAGIIDTGVNKVLQDKRVSLITLIARPEQYAGKQVRVMGFLNIEFEGDAIYFHKEDHDLGIDKNALWINLDSARIDTGRYKICNKQYVLLEGTFQMSDQGHQGSYGGSIKMITRLDLLNKRN